MMFCFYLFTCLLHCITLLLPCALSAASPKYAKMHMRPLFDSAGHAVLGSVISLSLESRCASSSDRCFRLRQHQVT